MATSQSGQIIPLTSRSWLKSLARRERKKLTLAAICGVLAGGLTVLLVVGLAWAIDQLVIHGRSPASLTVFSGIDVSGTTSLTASSNARSQ